MNYEMYPAVILSSFDWDGNIKEFIEHRGLKCFNGNCCEILMMLSLSIFQVKT